MSEDMLKYGKSGAIATITLNRPEKFNTLRSDMVRNFDEALRAANHDNDVQVIILEGAGDIFAPASISPTGWSMRGCTAKTATTPAWTSITPPTVTPAAFRSSWDCGAA